MIHRYEGVCVAKVTGYIEADTPEDARERLACRDYGEVTEIALQALNLMDDLDAIEEGEEGEEDEPHDQTNPRDPNYGTQNTLST